MDSVTVTVPLRPPTKKMKKRKELDALAPSHVVSRRTSGKRSSQELLTDSSDERSEYWNLTTRVNRKCASRRSGSCPGGLLRACSAFFACASVLATASLIWLFIDVRQQLTALRTELDQVRAGTEGVPDALQKCHSLSRDLQKNQTTIFAQLSELKDQINNITLQLSVMQQGLRQVQDSLQAAPELTNVPKNIKELSTNVASFGSEMRDLGATVKTLKETNSKLQVVQTSLLQNVTDIQHSLLDLSNITQMPPQSASSAESRIKVDELSSAISQLTNNLSHINETLSQNITWVVEDQAKDHKTLEELRDMTQNSSMKVMSLQEECAKASEQTNLVASVKKLTDQMSEVRAMDMKIKQLEQSYNVLKTSAGAMQSSILDMRNQRQQQSSRTQVPSRISQDYSGTPIPTNARGVPGL